MDNTILTEHSRITQRCLILPTPHGQAVVRADIRGNMSGRSTTFIPHLRMIDDPVEPLAFQSAHSAQLVWQL